jgi:hypothetical protein
MRLYESTDPSKHLPSRIEETKTGEYAERNQPCNVEEHAARRQTMNLQTKKMKPERT